MTTAEHTPFSAARRGYDRTQVDAQLDVLSAQLRAATSARHSALAQVEALSRKLEAGIGDIQSARAVSTQHRAEADELHGQVAALSTIPHTVDGMSERLQQMTRVAARPSRGPPSGRDAQRELDELCALQHQVSAQLTAVRALLDWTLPQMPDAGRGSSAPLDSPRGLSTMPTAATRPVHAHRRSI